jgi:hypothetical protein
MDKILKISEMSEINEKKISKKELMELIENINGWSAETSENMSEYVIPMDDLRMDIDEWFKE